MWTRGLRKMDMGIAQKPFYRSELVSPASGGGFR